MAFTRRTFKEALDLFYEKSKVAFDNYDKIPCEEHSSERCGGWLIMDSANMMIGWVGNLGEVQVYDYADRGVK